MNKEEFEKQTLNDLIADLKDIDKYTSFKNGVFIYDLGKYQGTLLVNEIERLNNIIDKAIEYIKSYLPNYDFDHSNLEELLKILGGTDEIN